MGHTLTVCLYTQGHGRTACTFGLLHQIRILWTLKHEHPDHANYALYRHTVVAVWFICIQGEDPFNNDVREELLNGDQEDSSSTEGDLNQVEDILMADEMQLEDV